jgi:hypothetical protein
MEVGDRAERPACDKYDGLPLWVALQQVEAVVRKGVIRRRVEARAGSAVALWRRGGHGGGLRRRKGRKRLGNGVG